MSGHGFHRLQTAAATTEQIRSIAPSLAQREDRPIATPVPPALACCLARSTRATRFFATGVAAGVAPWFAPWFAACLAADFTGIVAHGRSAAEKDRRRAAGHPRGGLPPARRGRPDHRRVRDPQGLRPRPRRQLLPRRRDGRRPPLRRGEDHAGDHGPQARWYGCPSSTRLRNAEFLRSSACDNAGFQAASSDLFANLEYLVKDPAASSSRAKHLDALCTHAANLARSIASNPAMWTFGPWTLDDGTPVVSPSFLRNAREVVWSEVA